MIKMLKSSWSVVKQNVLQWTVQERCALFSVRTEPARVIERVRRGKIDFCQQSESLVHAKFSYQVKFHQWIFLERGDVVVIELRDGPPCEVSFDVCEVGRPRTSVRLDSTTGREFGRAIVASDEPHEGSCRLDWIVPEPLVLRRVRSTAMWRITRLVYNNRLVLWEDEPDGGVVEFSVVLGPLSTLSVELEERETSARGRWHASVQLDYEPIDRSIARTISRLLDPARAMRDRVVAEALWNHPARALECEWALCRRLLRDLTRLDRLGESRTAGDVIAGDGE